MELFNLRIPRITGLVDTGLVPGEPSSSPRYAVDSERRRWIRKHERDSGPPELLAEALSYLLATELEVPMPPAAVCLDAGERSWLSEHVRDTKHWDPDLADLVSNVEGLGHMLALDALVFNEDRHAGNILVQPAPDAASVRLWAIDFGVAVIGYPSRYAARTNDVPSVHNHANGLPLESAWEAALTTAERAAEMSATLLHAFVDESCKIAGETATGLLFGTLEARCRQAPQLVAAHLTAIAKLR